MKTLPLLALLGLAVAPLHAETKPASLPPAERYYSFGRPEDKGDFRTLLRTFRHPASGETVVLMGAVHLADESFYARFNEEIRRSDLVLLEGVSGSPGLGSLPLVYQSGLASRMVDPARLAHQGEMIPGDAPQCRNADVTLLEISPGWGATLWGVVTLPLTAIIGETAVFGQTLGDYGARLTGNGGAYAAWHREQLASTLASASPEDLPNDELIIDKRNAVVLSHLDKHITAGKPGRVLIPWGAAHGTGLEKGLRTRGYEPLSDEWVTAVSVGSYERADYTTPGHAYRFHVPLVFSVRGSDTTLTHSGPLWLWHHTRCPAGTDSSLGWVLYSDAATARGESHTAVLAGLGHLSKEDPESGESITLLGLARYRETDKKADITFTHAVLGIHATESSPEHTRVRLGWWGSIFNHEEQEGGYQTTSVLPHLFGRPLLYDSKTLDGHTTRRALLFFKW